EPAPAKVRTRPIAQARDLLARLACQLIELTGRACPSHQLVHRVELQARTARDPECDTAPRRDQRRGGAGQCRLIPPDGVSGSIEWAIGIHQRGWPSAARALVASGFPGSTAS